MLILFIYVFIGAIVALASEVYLAVIRCKQGCYGSILEAIYSQAWWLLLIEYFVDLFTWPERILSIMWYLIFKDLLPWRKWLLEMYYRNL